MIITTSANEHLNKEGHIHIKKEKTPYRGLTIMTLRPSLTSVMLLAIWVKLPHFKDILEENPRHGRWP